MSDREHFYIEKNISNTEYSQDPTFKFGFTANHVIIINNRGDILWSYNGEDLDGRLKRCDKSVTFDNTRISRIWFKTSNGKSTRIVVWAWV